MGSYVFIVRLGDLGLMSVQALFKWKLGEVAVNSNLAPRHTTRQRETRDVGKYKLTGDRTQVS